MTAETRVRVSADQAWDLVGARFGDIAGWAAPITASSLDVAAAAVGAVRTCHVQGFGPMGEMVLQERLLEFDPAARSLRYEAASGMPWFVRGATNRWTVRPDGPDACVVRTDATLHLVWWLQPLAPLVARRMRREGAAVLQELAHRLQTGRPHPRKGAARSARTSLSAPTVDR